MDHFNIIPVTFLGGTGGNIITQLLIKAKNNDFSTINLSVTGNAHSNLQDIHPKCTFGVNMPDNVKINHIIRYKFTLNNKVSPYFITLHLTNLELGKMHFSKIIRITYDYDDIEEISKIFLIKTCRYPDINFYPNFKLYFLLRLKSRIEVTKIYKPIFNNVIDDRILCISWKEIYKDKISNLIDKLSNFTEIPIINFNLNLMKQWREITEKCISDINIHI